MSEPHSGHAMVAQAASQPDEQAPASPFPAVRQVGTGPAWPTLAVISAGGVLGALARYALALAFPNPPGGFPWATFGINVTGCLLIGALMVLITDVWPAQRSLRPFLGTGLLGGFTTFSAYVVDVQRLLDRGEASTALAYLAGTALAALTAVQLGIVLTRLAVLARHRRDTRDHRRHRKIAR